MTTHQVDSRQQDWQKLKQTSKERGEWIRAYSFRDSFGMRCHYQNRTRGTKCSNGAQLRARARAYLWESHQTTTKAFASTAEPSVQQRWIKTKPSITSRRCLAGGLMRSRSTSSDNLRETWWWIKRNLKSQQAISRISIATLTTNKDQRKISHQYFNSLKQKLVSQQPIKKQTNRDS